MGGGKSQTTMIMLAVVVVLIAFVLLEPQEAEGRSSGLTPQQIEAERAYRSTAIYTPPQNGNASFSLSGTCNKAYEKLRAQPGLAEGGSAYTGVPPDQLRTANQISQKVFCTQVAVVEKLATKAWEGLKSIF